MSVLDRQINRLLFSVCAILSFCCFFICVFCIQNDSKHIIALLPAGYFIIHILFKSNFSEATTNISKTIIQMQYFVRLVVLPIMYSMCSEYQLFEGRTLNTEYYGLAVTLMLYEFVIVQMVLAFYERVRFNYALRIKRINVNANIGSYIIVFLAIFVFVMYLIMPGYSGMFKTILSLGDVNFTVGNGNSDFQLGTIQRGLRTLFQMAFQITRILLPTFILYRISLKDRESKWIKVVLVISCILQFAFLTATFAEAIVGCLTLVLFYIYLYPERRKKTFILLIVSTVGMLIVYFSVRYFVHTMSGLYQKSDGAIVYMAQIVNAYFTGIDNVVAIFSIDAGHEFESIKAGLIGAIPFNTTLFGFRGNKLQYFYNMANGSYGQIPPTIGTGYYYFGFLCSPIISCLFAYFSLKCLKKAETVKTPMKYVSYIFCCVTFALGTVMYSPSITLAWIVSWGIPMLLITWLLDDYY